uniref:Uncharacterized protein n=1 Tax=Cacopsylla melanoneura TaxID=428564 RepID=A0A8D8M4L9_9HEMI
MDKLNLFFNGNITPVRHFNHPLQILNDQERRVVFIVNRQFRNGQWSDVLVRSVHNGGVNLRRGILFGEAFDLLGSQLECGFLRRNFVDRVNVVVAEILHKLFFFLQDLLGERREDPGESNFNVYGKRTLWFQWFFQDNGPGRCSFNPC